MMPRRVLRNGHVNLVGHVDPSGMMEEVSDYPKWGVPPNFACYMMLRMSGVSDMRETIACPAWWQLDHCRNEVYALARRWFATRIGPVMAVSLLPGTKVVAHDTSGYYETFVIFLQTNEQMVAGGTDRTFRPGDVVWVDNSKEHVVDNLGITTVVMLVIDLHVESYGDGWREPEASGDRSAAATAGAGGGRRH